MPYIINKTNDTASGILVADGAMNASILSVVLLGRGFPNYGELMQENVVHILENFANSTPPNFPTPGQLWFDTSSNTLHVYQTTLQWRNVDEPLPGSIDNAAVAANAGISLSKLELGASGKIIVADNLGVPAYRTMSGDATINYAGVIELGANSVGTAELASGIDANFNTLSASVINASGIVVSGTTSLANNTVIVTPSHIAISGSAGAYLTMDDTANAGGSEIGIGTSSNTLYIYRPKDLSGLQVPATLGGGRELWRYEYINGLYVNNDGHFTGLVAAGASLSSGTTLTVGTDMYIGGEVKDKLVLNSASDSLMLKAGIDDYVFMEFAARTATPNTRTGYMGYPSIASTTLEIKNEISSGDLYLSTTGGNIVPNSTIRFPMVAASEANGILWGTNIDTFKLYVDYVAPAEQNMLVIETGNDADDFMRIRNANGASIQNIVDFYRNSVVFERPVTIQNSGVAEDTGLFVYSSPNTSLNTAKVLVGESSNNGGGLMYKPSMDYIEFIKRYNGVDTPLIRSLITETVNPTVEVLHDLDAQQHIFMQPTQSIGYYNAGVAYPILTVDGTYAASDLLIEPSRQLILGTGTGGTTIKSNVTADSIMHIGADSYINFYTNLSVGWASRKTFTFDGSGNFTNGGGRIIGVATPTSGTDGANKNYVDDKVGYYVVPNGNSHPPTTPQYAVAGKLTVFDAQQATDMPSEKANYWVGLNVAGSGASTRSAQLAINWDHAGASPEAHVNIRVNDDSGDTANWSNWRGLAWADEVTYIDPNILYIDTVNSRVGINNLSPSVALDVVGAAKISNGLNIAGGHLTVESVTSTGATGTNKLVFDTDPTFSNDLTITRNLIVNTDAIKTDSNKNVGFSTSTLKTNTDANKRNFQFGNYGNIITYGTSSGTFFTDNAHWNGAAFTYSNTAAATLVTVQNGTFNVQTAASGTALFPITWTPRLVITNDGIINPYSATGRTSALTSLTTTETIIKNRYVATQILTPGESWKIFASGICSATSSGTVTFTVKVGSAGTVADTSIASFAITTAASGTNIPFTVQLYVTFRSTGASAQTIVHGNLINNGTTGIYTSNTLVFSPTSSTSASTIINNYISLSHVTSTANVIDSFYDVIIEKCL